MQRSSRRHVLRCAAALVVGAAHNGDDVAASQGSRVLHRCGPRPTCVPNHFATLLIYTVDQLGASIGGASITVSPSIAQGPGNPPRDRYETDWYGMAALSLEPRTRYWARISCFGFHPLDIPELVVQTSALDAIHVRLEVDAAQLQ
jgi:hypothetical protein